MKLDYKYSDFTDASLLTAEKRLNEAKAVHDEWLPTVQRWQRDKNGWFKRTKKDWWSGVLRTLENAQRDYDNILASMSHEQNIGLVDLTTDMAMNTGKKPFPWSTLGLAFGGVVIVVIFYKLVVK